MADRKTPALPKGMRAWFTMSGRRDSNSRPPAPQTDALTRLRHGPTGGIHTDIPGRGKRESTAFHRLFRRFPRRHLQPHAQGGQTLAQMSLAWVLRNGGITTALIGASKPEQVIDCAGAIANLDFTADELAEIDRISEEKDLNLWAKSSAD